jgi:hypothetical protein
MLYPLAIKKQKVLKIEPSYAGSKWDYRLYFEYGKSLKTGSVVHTAVIKRLNKNNVIGVLDSGITLNKTGTKAVFSLVVEIGYPLSRKILDGSIVAGDLVDVELIVFSVKRIFESKQYLRFEIIALELDKWEKKTVPAWVNSQMQAKNFNEQLPVSSEFE